MRSPFFTFEPSNNNLPKKLDSILTGPKKPPYMVFSISYKSLLLVATPLLSTKTSLKESQKGKMYFSDFHRKSPLLIKVPHKTFFSPSFFEYKVSYHGKNMVNELGFPLNARTSFKSLYVFLKDYISNNKFLEQLRRHSTSMKRCKVTLP